MLTTESEIVRKTLEEARDVECDWCAKRVYLNMPDEAHAKYWHYLVYLNRDEHYGPLACTANGINGLLAKAGHDPVILLALAESSEKTNNHTIFFGEPSSYSDDEMSDIKLGGYTGPGWYFVDETEAHWYGPYETEEEAARKCVEYAKTI